MQRKDKVENMKLFEIPHEVLELITIVIFCLFCLFLWFTSFVLYKIYVYQICLHRMTNSYSYSNFLNYDTTKKIGPLKENIMKFVPGMHFGILDHVPFLQTGVELCVFWNCDKHLTSIVLAWGTLDPDARSETNPCDMWGTMQGAVKHTSVLVKKLLIKFVLDFNIFVAYNKLEFSYHST